jgi:16S rRNA (guanine(1405)-N(7))-methyltransferase
MMNPGVFPPDPEASNEDLVKRILSSPQYRALGITASPVRELVTQAQQRHSEKKEVEKTVKQKMHNLVAPYLGEIDYAKSTDQLTQAFASKSDELIRQTCIQLLTEHASTKERLPILSRFYEVIFNEIGLPATILDLACGLNPLALPWMGLPKDVHYYAYDIIQPRIRLINHFFKCYGYPELAETRDILVNPPTVQADAAFFFKEAHRFEQRQKGCNRAFWMSIPAKVLLVSLPTTNLSGSHPKLDQHRRLVYTTLEGLDWKVNELIFENEIVFIIRKTQ